MLLALFNATLPAKNIEIAYVSFASRPIIKRLNAYEDMLTNLKREIDEYSVITSEQTCQCLEKQCDMTPWMARHDDDA